MEYASQYRSCAQMRRSRSPGARGRPPASTLDSASSEEAAGSTSAATAHPYAVRNVGVKKKMAHPTVS
jgi:hypothetical protein